MSIKEITQLTREYRYKIELHAHTNPASPCSDMTPEMLITRYAELGFDGVVITNHFGVSFLNGLDPQKACSAYLKDYEETKSCGEKYNIRVYLGMEVRFPENSNDYLVYGIGERDVETVYSHIHSDYAFFYKAFKNDRNLILQAHPFRNNIVLQDPALLDGIEAFNMHQGHNSRNGFANQYANAHPHFIKTCGSDFHHEGNQGIGAVRMRVLPEDSFELARILKSKDYLFDITGSILIP